MSGVEIRVRANTTQARGELQKLEKSVGKIQSVTSGLANSIKSAVAAYSGFVSIKGIVSAADDLKNLENSIALVTGRGKESQATLQRLYAIAARGRSSIETTTATFNRFGLALSDSGKSTEEILAVTEAVAKAATLSGASAESARAAIIQLGQGLASGELRGEELNSVLEQTPRIAQAIADGMGKPFGELRSLAKDGQITSEAVFNALISQIGAIEKEFLTLEPTIGSLSVVMRDEFTRALAAIDNVAGFSDSARSKIEFLTTAFRFVADRAEIAFLRLQIGLLNLRMDFQDTAKKMYDSVAGIFSSDFTVEGFKTSVNEATESLKQFLGIGEQNSSNSAFEDLFSLPDIDVSGLLTNVDSFYNKIKAFGANVVKIFTTEYWKPLVGDSLIPAPFFEDEKEPGQKYTLEGILSEGVFADFIGKIKAFARSVKAAMADVILGVEVGPGNAQRSGGVGGFFEGIAKSISKFTDGLKLATVESESFKSATEFFTTRRAAVSEFFSSFLLDFNENGGILGYLNRTGDKLDEITSKLSTKTKTSVDNFFLGTPIGNEKDGRVGGAVSNTKGAVGSAVDFLSENKIAVAGAAIAGAIVFALPAELRSSLAQGALFGAGYVLAAGALFLLTQPITLAIGGLYFLPNILEFVNTSGLANKIGRTIGDGIVAFFKSDGEGASVGQQIISGIIEASGNFGQGLLDGLFGEDIDFAPVVEKAAGAFAIAIIGFATIGVVKNGLLGVTKGLAKGIFGVAFGTLGKTNLKTQIGGILGVVDDEKIKTKAKGKGSLLGKAFSTGMRAAIAGEATKIAGEIALTSVGDGKMDETESALLDVGADTVQGAIIGGTIGSAIPLVGTAAGAIAGGLIAGAFSVATNPKLSLAISEFSSGLYDSIADVLGKIPDKFGELTDAVSDKIKGWFAPVKTFFSDLFKSESSSGVPAAFSGYENLTQEDFIRMGNGFASGGYISGEGGPRDDKIPAMLSNGEFVIQASAVKKFGAGFMSMINNGMIPPGFMDGGYVSLINNKAAFESEIKKQKQTLGAAQKSGDDSKVALATKALEKAEKGLGLVEVGLLQYDENGNKIIAGATLGDTSTTTGSGDDDKKKKQAESLASSFQEDFRSSFYNAIKTGDFSNIFSEIADSFSSKVIESFATGFTDSLFEGLGLSGKDGILENLFKGTEQFGTKIGSGISGTIMDSFKDSDAGNGGLLKTLGGAAKSLFQGLGSTLSSAFSSLTSMLGGGSGGSSIFSSFSGIFSGISGFGSSLMSGISSFGSSIGSFFGFSEGGLVPNTSYSRAGIDSVPAMLTPGELVVPADKISDFTEMKTKSQQVYNINVSGDVSRQTRKEIVKMLPEITSGVNMNNRENNYRR